MYKDFVNVTPESGGAGTTPIAVAADENESCTQHFTQYCGWRCDTNCLYHSKENACGKPN